MMQSDEDITRNHSPDVTDIIDLTKDSPINRVERSRRRYTEDVLTTHDDLENHIHHYSRRKHTIHHLPMQNVIEYAKSTYNDIIYVGDIVTLDDTIEDDTHRISIEGDTHHAIEADDREPVPLTCPICFERLCSKLQPTTTRCGHVFCRKCLETFLKTSKKCPTCKCNVTLKSCIRLFL